MFLDTWEAVYAAYPDAVLLSATQFSMFTECERKWGFKYLAGIKPPQGAGAKLGTEVQDEQLDPWLATGRPFDFSRPSGEIANAIAPLLPAPRAPGLELRRKFVFPSPRGAFAYMGELDIFANDSRIVPGLELTGGPALCGDVKTTKNLAYAKTDESLKTDFQSIIYATDLLVQEQKDELDLIWFYVKTKKPHRSQRVHLRVTDGAAPGAKVSTAHVVEQFQRIDEIGSRITAIKTANPKADELPPNALMCDAYGGCPYRHICNLAPPVHAASVNMEAILSNIPQPASPNPAFLQSLIKPGAQLPPGVVPTNAPPGTPGTFQVHAAGAESALQPGQYTQAPALPPAPFPSPPGFQWNGTTFVTVSVPVPAPPTLPIATGVAQLNPAQLAAAQAAGYVPPPPAPVGVIPAAFAAPVPPPPPGQIMGARINPPESALPPAPPVGAAAPVQVPAEAPKKRGRPAGSKNNAAEDVTSIDLDGLRIPRAALATFLRAWAENVEAGS